MLDWAECHWLWRERCFGHLAKNAGDPIVRGIAFTFIDEISRAIEILSVSLHVNPLATRYALLYTHNQCQVIDSGAVSQLETELRKERRTATPDDLYKSAVVNRLTGANKKALELSESCIDASPSHSACLSLLGWLKSNQDKAKARTYFISALKCDKDNCDALLGEIECSGNISLEEKLNRLNRIIVKEPNRVAPYIERARLHLRRRDWERAQDSMSRALQIKSNSVQAIQFMALRSVVGGKYEEALTWIDKLKVVLESEESKSWWLYTNFSASIVRCCSKKNTPVIRACLEITQFAVDHFPHLEEPLLEAGYQAYLAGDVAVAQKRFSSATQLESRSTKALVYLTIANLSVQGPSRQVREQAEFLMELREKSIEVEVGILALRSCLILGEAAVELIDSIVTKIQTSADLLPFGPEYLVALDPMRLLQLAQYYPDEFEGKRRKLLGVVVETVPGLLEGRIALVESHLSLGEVEEAKTVLEVVEKSSGPIIHIVMAQIHTLLGSLDKAKSSLELALSWDLGAKEIPGYKFTEALVLQLEKNDSKPIILALQDCLLLHFKDSKNSLSKRELGKAFLMLVEELISMKKFSEAEKELERAEEELGGGWESGALELAKAHISIAKGDSQTALDILSKVNKKKTHFFEAQKMKADIYLNQMKDEQSYTECFRKLAEEDPSTENFLLLGDAYLFIQESELALENYERAMMCSSNNPRILCRLARVLVRCHQYAKAIKCYRDSGVEGSLELAELLLKLGQTDKAEAALSEISIMNKVFVLAKIFEKVGKLEEGLEMLRKVEEEVGGWGEPASLAKINEVMGSFACQLRRFDLAIDCYKKALRPDPTQNHIQIALANLFTQVGDWSACESACSSVLSQDPQNEKALLMLADLSFRRVDFTRARTHLENLLAARPTNWVALARLVQVLRRTAKLKEILPYLDAARAIDPNSPGLAYATGLYHWYTGKMEEAVESLNKARGDPEWGGRAAHDLAEVVLSASNGGATADGVWNLLEELSPATPGEEARLSLLRSFARLASQDSKQVERATIEFTQMANSDSQRIGPTLGLAMCYTLQKQGTRARSVLKRIVKANWSLEDAEHLEKAWLLLADLIVTGGGKSDSAQEVLARVIRHNKSSARAHELLGLIAEKDHKYYEASHCYDEAWKLGGESDPGLGYRLAFNLIKSKCYADAISVSQTVLKLHPEYPRIKKDVFDKAIAHLRT